MRTKQMPKQETLYDLKRYRVVEGKTIKDGTVVYNVPYAMCKALKSRAEMSPHLPQTFWKIEVNKV